jgi:hypothetical protein
MRVNLDLEPTVEQIQQQALKIFGDDYFGFYLGLDGYEDDKSWLQRVDMEHAAEQYLWRRLNNQSQPENMCN